MGHRLLQPEVALQETLITELGRNNDCLFAVAYINLAAVKALADTLARRLEQTRFSLRVVFRASDLCTDPAALDELLRLKRGRSGTLELRWSTTQEFHAKAYGFRATKASGSTVVLGSANLTAKALGMDSGELGVHLAVSTLADTAWTALEDFWEEGKPVTPAWLREYRKHYARKEKKAQKANAEVSTWGKKFRRRKRFLPKQNLEIQPLFVDQVEPASSEEMKLVNRALDATKKSEPLKLPDNWVLCANRAAAYAVPYGRNVIQMFWFSSNASLGVKTISVVRLVKRRRVVDPKDGSVHWILYFLPMRGARLSLRRRDRKQNLVLLARLGFDWESLGEIQGVLRRGKFRFLRAIKQLGFRTK